ncbi:hypothetical protein SOASR030_01780 [Leminorella grimontii]|uniref:Rhs family protein n=1 Tax=Leminorella grimontii TaxID=82981 RepID=A0AAV5MW50_9GAMM|nr:hypothetical protein [Leminorella grimontii]GKX54066.1 hypothetical protein SOASR030_01780 [Leminorella grimontii]VFS60162.1 Uncharacterised protein [Leminorella grimontii]
MLTIGEKYETKNGQYFEYTEDRTQFDPGWPFFGEVFNQDGSFDRIAYYRPSGRYTDSRLGSGYDLITSR